MTPQVRRWYYPHFLGRETEAQGGRSHSGLHSRAGMWEAGAEAGELSRLGETAGAEAPRGQRVWPF